MASFNSVTLLGNVTRDIELRYIPSGTAVVDLPLAVNNSRKKGDQWIEEPCFIDCVLWGKTAELAQQYLSKGRQVLISGELEQDNWVDGDGNKRSKHKVKCNKMVFVGGNGNKVVSESVSEPVESNVPNVDVNTDIPF